MHIKFKKIVIDNFLSIGHGEITLENKGYTHLKKTLILLKNLIVL